MAEEEAVHIRVTGKQLGIAITTLVVIVGSYPLANSYTSVVRNDPFTGVDGSELEDRIEAIELGYESCQRERYSHNQKQAEAVATLKAKTLSNEYLIKQCMRITAQ